MSTNTDEAIQTTQTAKRDGYLPVSLRCVPMEGLQGLECHIDNQGNFTLYCNSATEFTNDDKNRLLHEGIEFLYIEKNKAANYYRVVQDTLKKIAVNISITQGMRAQFIYDTASVLAENFYESIASGQFSMTDLYAQVRKVAEAIVEFFVIEDQPFRHILNLMSHEESVGVHSANVCFYSMAIASRLKLTRDDYLDLAIGTLFHDLGKAKLPAALLTPAAPLNPEQILQFNRHVEYGVQMLKTVDAVAPEIVRIVQEHHETLDGKGYPGGLAEKHLSELGKIAAVANQYDTMTSARAGGSEPQPVEQVLGYLNDCSYGRYFAPAVRALAASLCLSTSTTALAKRLQEVADTEWEETFDTPRRHKRHYMRMSAIVREVFKDGDKVTMSKPEKFMLSNISRSGFAFLSARPFRKETNICLTVEDLNGPGRHANMLGRVVWCEKNISQWFVTGCQFYKIINKAEVARIRQTGPAKKK